MKIVRMLNVLYTTFDVLTDPRKNPNIYKVYIYIQKKRSMSSMIDSAVNFSRKRQMTLLERHLCQVKRTEMGVGTCPQMGRQSFFFFFFVGLLQTFKFGLYFGRAHQTVKIAVSRYLTKSLTCRPCPLWHP